MLEGTATAHGFIQEPFYFARSAETYRVPECFFFCYHKE